MRRVVLLCLLTVSCASAPTQPVSRVAHFGGRTLEAVHSLQRVVADLEAQRLIPTDAAAQVMIATYEAGKVGEQLATLLQAYEEAGGSPDVALDIGAVVNLMDGLLLKVLRVDLGPNRGQITTLVNNVFTLMNSIRAAVPGLMKTPTTGGIIGYRFPAPYPVAQ